MKFKTTFDMKFKTASGKNICDYIEMSSCRKLPTCLILISYKFIIFLTSVIFLQTSETLHFTTEKFI